MYRFRIYMYMYVYIYVYMYVYIYVYIYIYFSTLPPVVWKQYGAATATRIIGFNKVINRIVPVFVHLKCFYL